MAIAFRTWSYEQCINNLSLSIGNKNADRLLHTIAKYVLAHKFV